MLYAIVNSMQNIDNAIKAKDIVLLTDLVNDEIAKLFVFGKDLLINIVGRDIKNDDELLDVLINNMSNIDFSQKVIQAIAVNNEIEIKKDRINKYAKIFSKVVNKNSKQSIKNKISGYENIKKSKELNKNKQFDGYSFGKKIKTIAVTVTATTIVIAGTLAYLVYKKKLTINK